MTKHKTQMVITNITNKGYPKNATLPAFITNYLYYLRWGRKNKKNRYANLITLIYNIQYRFILYSAAEP